MSSAISASSWRSCSSKLSAEVPSLLRAGWVIAGESGGREGSLKTGVAAGGLDAVVCAGVTDGENLGGACGCVDDEAAIGGGDMVTRGGSDGVARTERLGDVGGTDARREGTGDARCEGTGDARREGTGDARREGTGDSRREGTGDARRSRDDAVGDASRSSGRPRRREGPARGGGVGSTSGVSCSCLARRAWRPLPRRARAF